MPKKPLAEWRAISDAYWLRSGNIPEPWSRVPKRIRMAVAMGLFHTQMERNGAQFWVTNGYHASCARQLLARLADLDSDVARELASMVRELGAIGREAERWEESADEEADAALEALAVRCEALDRRYRQLGPALMDEVDAWLVASRGP